MGKYFGTDGFRGEANVGLTVMHAFEIGRYLGWYYGRDHKARIVIGKDTRRSSYMFESALCAGLTASGADACLLHVTTTPSVSFVARADDFDCGIMISASHNPYYDNGIKLINGRGEKMDDEMLSGIEEYIDRVQSGEKDTLPYAVGEKIGRTVDYSAGRNRYIGYLISLATRSYKGKKVGLDCANGSTWMMAKSVFDALGADTYVIANNPDGININVDCGSTHIEKLRSFVLEKGLDVGFAFDGDADRCLAVDEKGNVVNGDQMIAIFARQMQAEGRLPGNAAVVTVMSSFGFFRFAREQGIHAETTKVGDRYVLENMRKNGYNIGGEQSGHIIFREYMPTGDGELSAIQLMRTMKQTGEPLSVLAGRMPVTPQVLLNVAAGRDMKEALHESPEMEALIQQCEEILGNAGRILIRPSGTEPLIRVMVEGEDDTLIGELAGRLAAGIEKYLK